MSPLLLALQVALLVASASLLACLVPLRRAAVRGRLDVAEEQPVPRRVLIVSASIGAGHDGAATELARQARVQGFSVDRVDFLDLLPAGTGGLLRTAYRLQLMMAPATWGWLLPRLGSAPGGGWAARLPARLTRRRLLTACRPVPALVVSTYPLASQALARLRVDGRLDAPVATFLTDMSVHPLWVAPGVDHHLALHGIPALQARSLGARDVRVVGPAVSPAFRPATPRSRREARTEFGLPADGRLALVVAGSWGVGDILRTVDDLLGTGAVTPVVVCGSNRALRRAVASRDGAVGLAWVADMPVLMRGCDLVVQNAGGLTSLEACRSGLPVLTYRSLPGHGVTNNGALDSAGWATWVHAAEDLLPSVQEALIARRLASADHEVPWTALTGVAQCEPA